MHNQYVAFASTSDTNDQGILVASLGGGTPKLVADLNTPVPGKTGNFTSLYAPALDDSHVAFVGVYGSGQAGIYEYSFGGSYSQTIANRFGPDFTFAAPRCIDLQFDIRLRFGFVSQ